jgi:N-acetylneuraminate lyase
MEAFYADQLEKAKLYQQHSIDLIHLIDAYGGIATGKAFMRIIGLDCGEFRLPVQNMSASEFLDFKQSLEQLNISDIAF